MIAKADLFSTRKDLLIGFIFFFSLLFLSLFLEYKNYQNFTKFDNHEMDLYVLTQYSKTKNGKTYEVLKLKTVDGVSFYSISKLPIKDLSGAKIRARIWTPKVSFEDYMRGFYARAQLLGVYDENLARYDLADKLSFEHKDKVVAQIYSALFFATPIDKSIRDKLAALGISHLLAISGFHLGVLSFLLFFLLKIPYTFLQNRYAPYRHRSFDLMVIVISILWAYIYLLGFTPSLLRSFVMMIVGFVLYDRGLKVLSMQTLLLSILLLLGLFPRLLFSVGFYLSIAGVFYIFLFLKTFDKLSKLATFIGIHIWVYLMMLPLSLFIFESYSVFHPFSILFTMLFLLFYPLVLFLHLTPYSSALDGLLSGLFSYNIETVSVGINLWVFLSFIFLSLLSIRFKKLAYLLLVYVIFIAIYAVYQVAQS